MRVTAPAYLLLLFVFVWFWLTLRRSSSSERERSRSLVVLRCAVATLLVLALSGLQVMSGQAPLTVMFVVDVSESMAGAREESRRRLDVLMEKLRRSDTAGVVVFGGTAVIDRAPGAPMVVAADVGADVPATASDLEAGLRLARTALPSAGARRIVLLSDGQQTQGDALREASLATADGIAIDVAAPTSSPQRRRVAVLRLSAPSTVAVGEPFTVSAVAEGPPGERGEIIIQGDNNPVTRQEVSFSSTGLATVAHLGRERDAGVHIYRAGIRSLAPDAFAEPLDLSDGAAVVVSGRPRVLYVSENGAGSNAVISSGFDVDSIPAVRLPRSVFLLASYDAVVLDDVRTDTLDEAQISALGQHVEGRGSGLLVLGSARSLEGLFPDRGLGKFLPIDLRPRAGRRASEFAIVVVFDKSGSMDDRVGGTAKIEFARQGVQRLLDAVAPTDAVGVIAFDTRPTAVAPLSVGHNPLNLAERLRSIQPAGGTAIAPAVQLAREWLASRGLGQLSQQQILLVTDGRSSAGDAEQLRALVREGRFRLSVISLGEGRDRSLLMSLADATGGRSYFPEDARDLPNLVAREAARVTGGRLIEESFIPRPAQHPITTGAHNATFPRLTGYVVSVPRPTAEAVLSSHRNDPILATWRHGLGKVAVYTADLHSAWSAQLRVSNVFAPMMTQTMRWVARSVNHESLYTRVQDRDGRVSLVVDAHRREVPISLLDLRASIRRPSGEIEDLDLAEMVPGRYQADVPVAQAGAYVISLDARSRDGAFAADLVRGFYWSGSRERRAQGVNDALLTRLAQTTGGIRLDSEAEPFADRPPTYWDLRPWLLGAAFLLFLADLLGLRVFRRLERGQRSSTTAARREVA